MRMISSDRQNTGTSSQAAPPQYGDAHLLPGTGIWVACRSADNETVWVAAHVSRWNKLAAAYHVVPDHDPHRPFFAGAARIVRRYVGEVAPGVVRHCP